MNEIDKEDAATDDEDESMGFVKEIEREGEATDDDEAAIDRDAVFSEIDKAFGESELTWRFAGTNLATLALGALPCLGESAEDDEVEARH